MEVYLIRHGEVDPDGTVNPPLSERGHLQARAVSKECKKWNVQLLCVSTMLRAQQTANEMAVTVPRLNLVGLEEVNLSLYPNPGWEQVVTTLKYIRTFAEAKNFDRVAIVAHGGTIMFSLLYWLGLGPQAINEVRFGFSHCGTTKVVLNKKRPVRIEWINRRGRNV